jgi:hypothetical protein
MFIFASKYEIPRLRQNAIDRLVWCHNRFKNEQDEELPPDYISLATNPRVYEFTQLDAPIRKLLSDGYFEFAEHNEALVSV